MTQTTNTTNQAATGMGEVIEAMRSIQSESDRWHLAESLRQMIPSGLTGFSDIIDAATAEGVAGSLSANTLRLYRDAAARWPADKRVPNVSFSAHREAMVLPSIDEAARVLAQLAKQLGAAKVTVAEVRKAVAVKQGKVTKAAAAASSSTSKGATTTQANVLADLMAGAPTLIASITATTSPTELDKLHAGLTKTIGHVERLRAKAARKATAAAKKAPAAKASVRKSTPRGRKSTGDLRGL